MIPPKQAPRKNDEAGKPSKQPPKNILTEWLKNGKEGAKTTPLLEKIRVEVRTKEGESCEFKRGICKTHNCKAEKTTTNEKKWGKKLQWIWCCNNCPKDHCPRRQLSKGVLSNDTVVQTDYCPRRFLSKEAFTSKKLAQINFSFSVLRLTIQVCPKGVCPPYQVKG